MPDVEIIQEIKKCGFLPKILENLSLNLHAIKQFKRKIGVTEAYVKHACGLTMAFIINLPPPIHVA